MKAIRIAEYLKIEEGKDKVFIKCTECESIICNADENYKLKVPFIDRNPAEIGHKMVRSDWIVYREYYCPQCATLLEVVVKRPQDEDFLDCSIEL